MALSDLAAIVLAQPDGFALQATAYDAEALNYNVPPMNLGRGSSGGPLFRGANQVYRQYLDIVVFVGAAARLSTSAGADVDSFVNAFGVFRNLATNGGGQVTFSVTNDVATGLAVPLGTVVKTDDNQQFVVVPDESQAGYVAPDPTAAVGTFAYSGGYQGAANTNTVTATVLAVLAGTANGNCDAGAVVQVVSGPGTPSDPSLSVSNQNAFASATDAEEDPDLVDRFQDFMAGSGNGSVLAIIAAVLAVQPGNLVCQVGNLKTQSGAYSRGFFSVFVNVRGSGTGPSSALLAAVGTAVGGTVDANGDQQGGVVAAGMDFGVYAPTLVDVNVAATCILDGTVPAATVQANAEAALAAYIDASGMSPSGASTTVPYALILGSLMVPGVAYVTGATVNGGYADVVVGYGQQAVAGTLTVATANG